MSNKKTETILNVTTDGILDIPEEMAEFEIEGESTDTMIVKLKETHMEQQSELVKDLKYMSDESKKIIDEINVIEVDLEKYQEEIDSWIKTVGNMEGFVEKIKGVEEPFAKKSKNMSKLKEYLAGERKRR